MPTIRHTNAPGQDDLPLRSALAHELFPGRSMLSLQEVANAAGLTTAHLVNMIDAGDLVAIDMRTSRPPTGEHKTSRRWLRIPVSAYDTLIRSRSTLQ